jgi:hypothetical protein
MSLYKSNCIEAAMSWVESKDDTGKHGKEVGSILDLQIISATTVFSVTNLSLLVCTVVKTMCAGLIGCVGLRSPDL